MKSKLAPTIGLTLSLAAVIIGLLGARSVLLLPSGEPIISWIQNWPLALQSPMVFFLALGTMIFTALAVVAAFAAKRYWLAWRLAFFVIASYGLAWAVQLLMDRPAAAQMYAPQIMRSPALLVDFPMSYTAVATGAMVAAWPCLGKARWPLTLCIPIVAAASIYLGVAGILDALLGVAVALIIVSVLSFFRSPFRALTRL